MATKTAPVLPITGVPEADELLLTDPLALLIGMLLDQQVPMGWAFRGPFVLRQRLHDRGLELDAATLASLGQEEVVAMMCAKPALHRYPAVMGRRIWELSQFVVDEWGGDAGRIWRKVPDGAELYRRLRELPGYGDEKARIFLAILGKRLGVAPIGWEEAAAPFSDDTPRSVADVSSPAALAAVKQFKKQKRAEGKGKAD